MRTAKGGQKRDRTRVRVGLAEAVVRAQSGERAYPVKAACFHRGEVHGFHSRYMVAWAVSRLAGLGLWGQRTAMTCWSEE